MQRIPDGPGQRCYEPFLHVLSASTGQRFKLFLRLGPLLARPVGGTFNSYGLSAQATTPWF